VIALSGELDLQSVQGLNEALTLALRDEKTSIVADLSGVTFMDSMGLGALVSAYRRARGRLRLIDAQPIVVNLFAAVGLADMLG
jgi:anti-anti-sigma factor